MPAPTRSVLTALALATALAGPVQSSQSARFQFCWIGGGGYTMRGTIGFPAELLGTGIITEEHVTEFRITGFLDGLPVGAWSLDQLKPETTWVLRFDTRAMAFPMGGDRHLGTYQAWNANGQVNDCGENGFGFNGGDWAQDICLDNTYVEISSIDRYTPLTVLPAGTPMRCEATLPMM